MSDPVYIVCAEIDLPGAIRVAGSITTTCDFCGAEIMISPSGQEMRDEHDGTMVCSACCEATLAPKMGPGVQFGVTKDALAELLKTLAKKREP